MSAIFNFYSSSIATNFFVNHIGIFFFDYEKYVDDIYASELLQICSNSVINLCKLFKELLYGCKICNLLYNVLIIVDVFLYSSFKIQIVTL